MNFFMKAQPSHGISMAQVLPSGMPRKAHNIAWSTTLNGSLRPFAINNAISVSDGSREQQPPCMAWFTHLRDS